jgi:hypothetical protein
MPIAPSSTPNQTEARALRDQLKHTISAGVRFAGSRGVEGVYVAAWVLARRP